VNVELLLWRWSTLAQIASSLTIAIFFVVLARSVRRVELQAWVAAWLVNLVALLVTVTFWFAQPQSAAALIGARFAYFAAKTLFAVLLTMGAWQFARGGGLAGVRAATSAVLIASAIAAVTLGSIDQIGVVQSGVIAALLGAAAAVLLTRGGPGLRWLAAGFLLRAALAALETAAYGTRVFDGPLAAAPGTGVFLAAHSSFDAGAEWVIALGCVLALYRTIQRELTETNASLFDAKEVLQQLADRDPLTGLANRRALPAILRSAYETGAAILFFDLNGFKALNDTRGHQAGDECLKRFARVLQETFRPADHVVRYAGDEFVVIAPSAGPGQLTDRVARLRERLAAGDGPPISFSVGQSHLPVHGEPEAALKAADAAMYRAKESGRR
jgi:diguanylate cyclase (GGDEF)-like protein